MSSQKKSCPVNCERVEDNGEGKQFFCSDFDKSMKRISLFSKQKDIEGWHMLSRHQDGGKKSTIRINKTHVRK